MNTFLEARIAAAKAFSIFFLIAVLVGVIQANKPAEATPSPECSLCHYTKVALPNPSNFGHYPF